MRCYNVKSKEHQPKFSAHENVYVSMDDQSHYLIMPNAKEQRVSKKSKTGREEESFAEM